MTCAIINMTVVKDKIIIIRLFTHDIAVQFICQLKSFRIF